MSLTPIYPHYHTQHISLSAHVCPISRSRPTPQVCHASTTTLSRLRDTYTHYWTHRHTLGPTGTGRGGAIISIMSIAPIISISIIKKNNLYCWRKVMCYIDLKTPAPEALLSERTRWHPCSGESIQLNVYGDGPVHTKELTQNDKANKHHGPARTRTCA